MLELASQNSGAIEFLAFSHTPPRSPNRAGEILPWRCDLLAFYPFRDVFQSRFISTLIIVSTGLLLPSSLSPPTCGRNAQPFLYSPRPDLRGHQSVRH